MGRAAGCSHTTVSGAFSAPRLPAWGLLELLVEELGGDTSDFHRLWLAAWRQRRRVHHPRHLRSPGGANELAAVRRHLETGSGLLLVTGEAGIGKTTLVAAAAALSAPNTFVARGSCLPLSAEAPMVPVTDVLRAILEVEEGEWLRRSLEECPAHVATTLARLLPELSQEAVVDAAGAPSQPLVFSAVAAALAALRSSRPLAVVVEDLHWADTATMALLERIVVQEHSLALVGTWRTEDVDTPATNQEWYTRIRRQSATGMLELQPLTRDETAQQLRLVTASEPAAPWVDLVHARSAGLPLFTEQLASQADDDAVPRLLADLFNQRLASVDPGGWRVARALAVCERGLDHVLLRRVVRMSHDELMDALHDLRDRHMLMASTGADVSLRHPLLAEAVRRRLVPGEEVDEHRRLAEALAARPDAAAAEIAAHWQAAAHTGEELAWRVQAAREAAGRAGPSEEAEHWLRALDIWPAEVELVGTPPIGRVRAALAAMLALEGSAQTERADRVAQGLLRDVDELPTAEAAELLALAADYEGVLRSPSEALELMERSVTAYESIPPSSDLVRALRSQSGVLSDLGRISDASTSLDKAIRVNDEVGDVAQARRPMAERARYDHALGRRGTAMERMARAARIDPGQPRPLRRHLRLSPPCGTTIGVRCARGCCGRGRSAWTCGLRAVGHRLDDRRLARHDHGDGAGPRRRGRTGLPPRRSAH